jgi:hypothetical protein
MEAEKRQAGFYRVKKGGIWLVARYSWTYKCWSLAGSDATLDDGYFSQIDEERILMPDEIKNTGTPDEPAELPPPGPQCDGWRRTGGAFTFGPPEWKRCERIANVRLTTKDEAGLIRDFPVCPDCWHEAIIIGVHILQAVPIRLQNE